MACALHLVREQAPSILAVSMYYLWTSAGIIEGAVHFKLAEIIVHCVSAVPPPKPGDKRKDAQTDSNNDGML